MNVSTAQINMVLIIKQRDILKKKFGDINDELRKDISFLLVVKRLNLKQVVFKILALILRLMFIITYNTF